MPVTSVNAPVVNPADPAGTPPTVSIGVTNGAALTRFTLFARDENGIITAVAQEDRAYVGNGARTVTFNPNSIDDLPSGNYTFFVSADNLISPDITGPDSSPIFVCFLAGTAIRTPTGDVAIESLRPGDLVLTADGSAEPVLFVGRQTVSSRFGNAETRDPILIQAGALDENLPERDLRVSPHHAIVLDGVLCFAQALVNGSTIRQIPAPADTFEYFSLELARHDVIIAEGQPVESFCDHVPRERFSNHAEFVALFPHGREVGEMDLPHAKSRRQVPAATLARIDARAQAIGTAPDQAAA
ncbi:Hint domain-containing protein [Roseomonas fluvialis]|uniref:Hedgehog/Intein (Hint) domain-containing protein n=1 Tax=Roseomonas fluvialis TaxID=1750527 RepID=A0ABM7Y166_9PROT|nr:Hint domain-containing protein [Roseomonas fluvialis]BDG71553.1 hypothetical protein Rmf_14820 [Roseomonas fluvialis]